MVKSVIFVPNTEHSELARRLREGEEEMLNITGYKIKIVERCGRGLTSILTKANPWGGSDCGRVGCLLCQTKADTGKYLTQNCSKRIIVYKTWCVACLKKSEDTQGAEGGIFQ